MYSDRKINLEIKTSQKSNVGEETTKIKADFSNIKNASRESKSRIF